VDPDGQFASVRRRCDRVEIEVPRSPRIVELEVLGGGE
jgi:hypothetical protein